MVLACPGLVTFRCSLSSGVQDGLSFFVFVGRREGVEDVVVMKSIHGFIVKSFVLLPFGGFYTLDILDSRYQS